MSVFCRDPVFAVFCPRWIPSNGTTRSDEAFTNRLRHMFLRRRSDDCLKRRRLSFRLPFVFLLFLIFVLFFFTLLLSSSRYPDSIAYNLVCVSQIDVYDIAQRFASSEVGWAGLVSNLNDVSFKLERKRHDRLCRHKRLAGHTFRLWHFFSQPRILTEYIHVRK